MYKNNDWTDGGSGLTPVILAQNDAAFNATGNPAAIAFEAGVFYLIDAVAILNGTAGTSQRFSLDCDVLIANNVTTERLAIEALAVSSNPNEPGNLSVLLNQARSIRQKGVFPTLQVGLWAWASVQFTDTTEAVFVDGNPYVNGVLPVRMLNNVGVGQRAYYGTSGIYTKIGFVLNGTAPSSGAGTWEIWNGSAWTSAGITDTTNGMRNDGTITVPAMSLRTVNLQNSRWLRFTVTSAYNAVPVGQLQICGNIGTNPTYDEYNVGFLIQANGSTYESTGLTIPSAGVILGMIAPKHFTGDLINLGINRDTGGGIFRVGYDGKVAIQGLSGSTIYSDFTVGGKGGANTSFEVSIGSGVVTQSYNRNTSAYGTYTLDGSSIILRPSGSTVLTVSTGAASVTGTLAVSSSLTAFNVTGTVTGGSSAIAGDFVVDSTVATQAAMRASNNTNFAHAGPIGQFRMLNATDTGPVIKIENAGTGNYITADSAFSVTKGADIKSQVAGGGLYLKEGTNATMGTATLVTGVKVVNTTKVTANSRIFLTTQSLGTVAAPKAVAVTARTAGTSFTITSADATDTSVIAWMIVEPS
jgi:hypothetical protein